MIDPRFTKLAQTLVQYCTNVQKRDRVAIVVQPEGFPLGLEVYREVLKAGGYPYTVTKLDEQDFVFFSEANDDQLAHINEFEKLMRLEFEVVIALFSEGNTKVLSNVDPEKQKKWVQARRPMIEKYVERTAAKDLRWVIAQYPTTAYAQEAGMSVHELAEYIFQTTYADLDDPVAKWTEIHDQQQQWVDWMEGKEKIIVKGPNADLSLSVKGRKFINADGKNNMPSGEIFTSPVEDSVEGWVRFTYPAIFLGREVEGIELKFEKGKVVEASAEKNEAFLLQMLDSDEGARYLGEFAIGTNKRIDRFIGSILFDEKIGGTIHMAVGYGFPEAGTQNKSAIHWDMICDMRDGGQIFVDDELIYESGDFKI
ncbi:MAG: aminopeptidase [Anaerolineales bacterium]|jgi:aminopeptidase